jgi:hypothetical protein
MKTIKEIRLEGCNMVNKLYSVMDRMHCIKKKLIMCTVHSSICKQNILCNVSNKNSHFVKSGVN